MRRIAPAAETIVDVEPRLIEHDFRVWFSSEVTPIGALLSALERRAWKPVDKSTACPEPYCRLTPPMLAELKRQIVERVAAAGGEYRTGSVVVWSDGEKMWVSLL